jgi:hypothetical protein
VEIVPTEASPPGTLLTCQVTAVLVVSVTVAVKACVSAPGCRLALVGETDTLTGEATAMALRQAFVPAVTAAVVVTAFGFTVTSAVSCRPASSVTVSRTVNGPDAGATTTAVFVLAPEMPELVPFTIDQAYASTV